MRVVAMVLGLLAATPALAETPVLIRGARVFDGERVVGTRDVLLRDGRIAAVARRITPPPGATVTEGKGRTLLPGLIDAHVHVFPSAAEDALRFGVTTEFDMFTLASPADVAARRAARASYAPTGAADVWSAGIGITPPGGHPTQLAAKMGASIPTLSPSDDPAAFVAARISEGSDHIKIFQDDGTAHGGSASLVRFPDARLAAIVGAAKATGKRVIVHVSKQDEARLAFTAGADAIAHLFQDGAADDTFVTLVRERGGAVIATLSVLASAAGDDTSARLAADPAIAPQLSPMQRGMLAARFPKQRPEVLPRALASIATLQRGGVTILAGTDAPNPGTAHGPSLHGELELLVRGGLSPAAALTAATAAPARFFGTADRGRIAPGLRADLLLVEGDPTATITATRRIVAIWKNGVPVDRAQLPTPPAPPPAAPPRS